MTFSLVAAEFALAAAESSILRSAQAMNVLRGALGSELHAHEPQYRRWFAPTWADGPSGYREAPRPFVLRRRLAPDRVIFQLIVFAVAWPFDEIRQATHAALRSFACGEPIGILGPHPVDLRLPSESPDLLEELRIVFETPTELKSHGEITKAPEFPVLIGRLAERVWSLGRLYNDWPADTSLSYLAKVSREVSLTSFEWSRAEQRRRSARSGTMHSIGGFIGWAEYFGRVAPLLPLLAIGAWTGVGRHTVWGKGAFHIDGATTPIPQPA